MRVVSLILVAACLAMSACADDDGSAGDGDGETDAAPPVTEPADCVSADIRDSQTVTVSGAVQDYASAEAIAAAEVAVSTAWDTGDTFPAECAPLATLTTSADGRFGPTLVGVGSPLTPPIAIFMVTGGERAATASDQRLVCEGDDCGNLGHTVAAPSQELAAAWRQELERGGMTNADTRGLVLFEFRNPDGSPAEGVTPERSLLVDTEVLSPDTEVRFLEPDRATLAPAGTSTTTASGVALIGIDADSPSELIAGTRGSDRWTETGVLDPPGWIFLEDKQQSAR